MGGWTELNNDGTTDMNKEADMMHNGFAPKGDMSNDNALICQGCKLNGSISCDGCRDLDLFEASDPLDGAQNRNEEGDL